jgi:YegS/Rv2252/BmrU family lipid kinase
MLITNPAASRTRTAVVGQIEGVFHRAGWQIDSVVTTGHGHARDFAAEAVAQHVDVVAVLGGDGTIMQAASALVGTDVPLGILPGGTGNQLAGNLRLSLNPVRAARALIDGAPRPFDLGRLESASGVHHFAVAGGAGIDARVMASTASVHKRRWGQLAYVATTLKLLSDVACAPFHIEVDGLVQEFEAAMVLVANCGGLVRPLFTLGQDVSPYDGMLDVIVLKAESVSGGFRAVWDVVREAEGIYGETVFAARIRGTQIRVLTPMGDEPTQVDGESVGCTPFTVTVLPGALRLIHPRGWRGG